MTIDFDVFGSFMKDLAGSNLNGRVIVTIDERWLKDGKVKFVKNVHDPLEFTCAGSQGLIFCFIGTSRNYWLFLGSPRDKGGTKIDKETGDRTSSVEACSPI